MLGDVTRQRSLFGDEVPAGGKRKKNDGWWRGIYVEGWPGGPRYLVSGTQGKMTCDCGKKGCSHIVVAEDVLHGDGKRFGSRWVCKSGFHKELRREDVQKAIAWSTWFRRFWGNKSPLNYMRGIWIEETCNIDLMEKIDKTNDVNEAIKLFCASRKKWEFKEALDVWMAFEQYQIKLNNILWEIAPTEEDEDEQVEILSTIAKPLFDDEKKVDEMLLSNSLPHIVKVIKSAENVSDEQATMKKCCTKLTKYLHDLGKLSLAQSDGLQRRFRYSCRDEYVVLAMLATGVYREEMKEYRELEGLTNEDAYLPYPRTYVLDYHTKRGKEMLKKWSRDTGNTLWFEVDLGDLDYRYAGGSIPLYWRWCAYEQYGRIDVPWQDVRLTGKRKEDAESMSGIWWRG